MPNEQLLYKYNLTQFLDVVRAVRYEDCLLLTFNPLSPNIHIQILQTDLNTFPLRIS